MIRRIGPIILIATILTLAMQMAERHALAAQFQEALSHPSSNAVAMYRTIRRFPFCRRVSSDVDASPVGLAVCQRSQIGDSHSNALRQGTADSNQAPVTASQESVSSHSAPPILIEPLPPVDNRDFVNDSRSSSSANTLVDPVYAYRHGSEPDSLGATQRFSQDRRHGHSVSLTTQSTATDDQLELLPPLADPLETFYPPTESITGHSGEAFQLEEIDSMFGHRPNSLEGYDVRTVSPASVRGSILDDLAGAPHGGDSYLDEYYSRIEARHDVLRLREDERLPSIPHGFSSWWEIEVANAEHAFGQPVWIGIDGLIDSALQHSPFVMSLVIEPYIRETAIVEQASSFDWIAFLETSFTDTNEPIGSTLITGNSADRFREHDWLASGGLRRRNLQGAEVEVSQRVNRVADNSTFLDPNPQANSRLEVSFVQPLLNGRGESYNGSKILLAEIETQVGRDLVIQELQSHLVSVSRAYWDLYRARAELVQRRRMLNSALYVLENLRGRVEVDALARQVLRAEAAVAQRRSEIARSVNSVQVAEAQLRAIVNDPVLTSGEIGEFAPIDIPRNQLPSVALRDGLTTALANRPDISKAIRDIRTSLVQLGVANHEMLPKLDLVLSTRVDGVESDSAIARSFGNQFAEGRPTYSAGFTFEVPIGNRLSQAQLARRQLEADRAFYDFQNTVERALLEVEVAVREMHTAHQEVIGAYHAMMAAENEVEFLTDRWQTLPDINDSATLLLEDLLDSQERLGQQEAAFVRAQVNYAVSFVVLRQSMGTLLKVDTLTAQSQR